MYLKPPTGGDGAAATDEGRRSFLKGLGATGLLGAMGSLAGCLGDDDDSVEGREEVQQLTFVGYPESNKNIHDTLTYICDEVGKLGFDIDYQGMNRERQLELGYSQQDYDLFSGGYTGRPHRLDPHMLLYKNYHSSQSDLGNYNWTNYDNEEVDELLDEQARTLDRDERQDIIHEVQAKIMEDPGGEIPIEHNSLINVTNTEDFDGFVQAAGLGLKNIWTWTQVEPTGDKTQLTAAVDLEIPWITPLWSNEANLITQRMTHDKLARINEEGLPEPWLAEDWETSDDDTTITVPIHDDFEFHDGEPLTAHDVAFTFNYLIEQEVPFFGDAVDPIESVEATDDYTVEINLEEPFAPFFVLTMSRVHILPEHVWENVPDNVDAPNAWEWSPTNSEWGLVGSGPFEFREWRQGEGVLMDANPDHPIAPPNVDSVYLREVTNPSALTAGLRNKEIDFAVRSSAQPSVLEDLAAEEDHLTFTETASVGYDEWSMNTNRKPFDSSAVRGAMAAMIPKQTIVDEIWDGYAIPAHSPTSPVLEFWYNDDVKKWPEVSQEEAIEMLEDDGFLVENDTVYYPEDVSPEGSD